MKIFENTKVEPSKVTTGLDLTIVVGYDKHSWTAGWKHFMDGMTVFYSEWGDKQLEQRASFQATPQNIPMLRLQLNNLRLFLNGSVLEKIKVKL